MGALVRPPRFMEHALELGAVIMDEIGQVLDMLPVQLASSCVPLKAVPTDLGVLHRCGGATRPHLKFVCRRLRGLSPTLAPYTTGPCGHDQE